jgi:hypothetical protein
VVIGRASVHLLQALSSQSRRRARPIVPATGTVVNRHLTTIGGHALRARRRQLLNTLTCSCLRLVIRLRLLSVLVVMLNDWSMFPKAHLHLCLLFPKSTVALFLFRLKFSNSR